jgi:hypothetical protein
MKGKLFRKIVGLVGLVCLALLVVMPPAHAFEGRGGDTVIVGADEIIEDDLYVGANTFILNGVVKGDLLVGGTTIEINGTVEGDLMAGGQSVAINGTVMDDVRIGAFAITLGENAQIADDMLVGAFSLETKGGSQISGDLVVGGAQALLAGDVAGDVLAGTEGLELRGSVGGNVEADVGQPGEGMGFNPFMFMPGMPAVPSVPGGLTVAESANIGGNLNYTSPAEFNVPAGSVAGQVTHDASPVAGTVAEMPPSPTELILGHVRRWVALLLVGLLLVGLVPTWVRRAADALQAKPLPSLGLGVVSIPVVIVVFLAIVVAMILLAVILGTATLDDLVGLVIALGLFDLFALAVLFGIAWAYLAKITVSFFSGRLILGRLNDDWAGSRVWPLVLGLVIFVVLTAIPRVGGVIDLILVLFGLGALVLVVWENWRRRAELPALTEA